MARPEDPADFLLDLGRALHGAAFPAEVIVRLLRGQAGGEATFAHVVLAGLELGTGLILAPRFSAGGGSPETELEGLSRGLPHRAGWERS